VKVLVVDDDRVLAEILAFTLQRLGLAVIQAYDGRSALQRWAEEAPDLIMLDVNLPDMSGFTLCQQIRAEDDTPIILLTVRGEEDDIVHGLEIGADDYITKPYSPRQLVGERYKLGTNSSAHNSGWISRSLPDSLLTQHHIWLSLRLLPCIWG